MKLCLAGRGILHYDGRRQKLDGNEKINPTDAMEYICLVSFPRVSEETGKN